MREDYRLWKGETTVIERNERRERKQRKRVRIEGSRKEQRNRKQENTIGYV